MSDVAIFCAYETLIQSYYDSLEQVKMRYPEQKELILKGYFYLQTDNAYVSLQKALYAEERHNIKEAPFRHTLMCEKRHNINERRTGLGTVIWLKSTAFA